MSLSEDILNFWFEDLDLTREREKRDLWFKSTPEFDQAIRDNFLTAYEDAAAGLLDEMMRCRESCLALILILDQFSRNLFRNNPQAFAADSKAREIARHALDNGFDQDLSEFVKIFFYLPFKHSEELADQELSVKLFSSMASERTVEPAIGHHDAIARFGRFPHRNEALGRTSTAAELAFLTEPDSSF